MTTLDSIFIYNSGIVSATAPGGYVFNDSIEIQISFELTDSNGNDTSYMFLNTDARGYALKFFEDFSKNKSIHKDWGGYGLVAPDFREHS